MMRELHFQSSLHEFISGFILEKRAVGYKYTSSAWTLYKFDQFCINQHYTETLITRDLAYAWIQRKSNEALATQQNRAGVLRQLALYMTRLGFPSYVLPPKILPRKEHYQPYIFSDTEIAAILSKVDACHYCSQVPLRHLIMPLLFRLLYGCGLRLSEALNLRLHNVDFGDGVLTIIDGKFNKDRLVPMSANNLERCRRYAQTAHPLSDDQAYFFPSPTGSPLTIGNVYKNYRRFLWQAGISHGGWGKGPRLHDIRHTHCVHCLRRWVLEGADLAAYLPILKTYMGHYSFQDTAHYLRLTAELFPDITAKTEQAFGDIIPRLEGDGNETDCDFAKALSHYLGIYLPGQRNVSTNTIKSYRDTFKLFLIYYQQSGHRSVDRLCLKDIDKSLVLGFLDWLEQERHNGISTRNQRLACIHGFYRYMHIEDPIRLLQYQQILSIPSKKAPATAVSHLTPDALTLILAQPDPSRSSGRRDLTLLSVLYDTGARVQELVDLRVRDVRFDPPAIITLTGKGRKKRQVPLMPNTESLVKQYISGYYSGSSMSIQPVRGSNALDSKASHSAS